MLTTFFKKNLFLLAQLLSFFWKKVKEIPESKYLKKFFLRLAELQKETLGFVVGKSHSVWEEYIHFQGLGWLTPLYLIGGVVIFGNLWVESLYLNREPGYILPEVKKEILSLLVENAYGDTLAETDIEAPFANDNLIIAQSPSLITNKSLFSESTSNVDREGRTVRREANYTVKEGDTLSEIANNFGLKTFTLKYVNKLTSENNIKPGQVLKIPAQDLSDKQIAKILAEERKLASTKKSSSKNKRGVILVSGEDKVVSEGKWITPLSYHYVSRGVQRGHTGIDYVAPRGTPVYSACGGVVVDVGSFGAYSGGRGNYISVNCGQGISMHYYHLSAYSENARPGRSLSAGTFLGSVGSTGYSTGDHLHFEVRKNGVPFDPGLR